MDKLENQLHRGTEQLLNELMHSDFGSKFVALIKELDKFNSGLEELPLEERETLLEAMKKKE